MVPDRSLRDTLLVYGMNVAMAPAEPFGSRIERSTKNGYMSIETCMRVDRRQEIGRFQKSQHETLAIKKFCGGDRGFIWGSEKDTSW